MPFTWEDKNGYEFARLSNGIVLRISYEHLPYSYGTKSYINLMMLTDKGWKVVYYVQTKESGYATGVGEGIMTEENAIANIKNHAEFLFGHYTRVSDVVPVTSVNTTT